MDPELRAALVGRTEEVTAMRRQATGRIIVGIDESLAGLQALREAAELARRLGMELVALRACRPASTATDFGYGPGAAPAGTYCLQPRLQDLSERIALSYIDDAFGEAMGGKPPGVTVEARITYDRPHRALAATARDDADLLVVGASRRHPWWPLRRSVGRYCAAHAGCPVLIVPPHEAARELDGAWQPWRWLRKRRELSSLLAGVSA